MPSTAHLALTLNPKPEPWNLESHSYDPLDFEDIPVSVAHCTDPEMHFHLSRRRLLLETPLSIPDICCSARAASEAKLRIVIMLCDQAETFGCAIVP